MNGIKKSGEAATVLIVDDSPDVISLVNDILRDEYRIRATPNGRMALKLLATGLPIDLILLDVVMDDLDGYEVLRQLRQMPHMDTVPVIFLTALRQDADESACLKLGAVDYIRKPINGEVLLARVRNHVDLKLARDMLCERNFNLEQEVARRSLENEQIQDITIMTLASLAETRDNETGNHILRTKNYVRILAELLQSRPRFCHYLSADRIKLLFKSAPLHDIGKVGVPDRILLKPGKLTPEEFELMKMHTIYGRDAITKAEIALGFKANFLATAKEIAAGHHEKWDGSGYPQGLAGDEIPISARLMAIADVYDALISRRCYKEPFPHQQVLSIINDGRGKHFDPEITDVFLQHEARFYEIASLYSET